MNARQREYFRRKLNAWREELLKESSQTLQHLQGDNLAAPDLADRATTESEQSIELRTRNRERKLISKIEVALGRIEDGSYGYCEETGEQIGLNGASGNATGCHLHFELWSAPGWFNGGKAVDPTPKLLAWDSWS